jgi:cytochrome c biogenesis protein
MGEAGTAGGAGGLGVTGWLRWAWRSLTSMRTALILLFLLALGAVPGSLVPQRTSAPLEVTQFIRDNPGLAVWYERLSLFDVYGSPWFAAIYLLLMVSLVGCVLPRARQHWKAMRARPPLTPRNLRRLPESRSYVTAAAPDAVLAAAGQSLRGKRFRVDVRPGDASQGGSVAAEKGYLRETGNLVFHLALIGILVGVAVGSLFGTQGTVLLREGAGFSNTVTQYDGFSAGPLADVEGLPPVSFTLDDFRVEFQRGGQQNGAPRLFEADLTVVDEPGAEPREVTVRVNEPLDVGGSKAFLLGHGYSAKVVVRDGSGRVVLDDFVPFLPQDGDFTSTGVVKAPDARPDQLGFQGILLPTASVDEVRGPISTFPALDYPALFLSAWYGDLGLDTGAAQSVYRLDTEGMTKVEELEALLPGETWVLPEGRGSITFESVGQWANFRVARDPGRGLALAAAVLTFVGLLGSLMVRRRRLWVRATPLPPSALPPSELSEFAGPMDRPFSDNSGSASGWTLVEVGALARAETYDLAPEVDEVLAALHSAAPPSTAPPSTELSETGRAIPRRISDNSEGARAGAGGDAVFAERAGRVDDVSVPYAGDALTAEEPRP